MEGIIADLAGAAHRERSPPRCGNGAAPQRVGRQFALNLAAIFITATLQKRLVFVTQQLRLFRRVAVDFNKCRAIGGASRYANLVRYRIAFTSGRNVSP